MSKSATKKLTIETLQALTPFDSHGMDTVSEASRALLVSCLKVEPCVHETFFPQAVPHPRASQVEPRLFHLPRLAAVYVAYTISRCKDDFKFHQAVDRMAAEDMLREMVAGLQWKKLGE